MRLGHLTGSIQSGQVI